MDRQRWLGGFWARSAVIATVVLLAAVGFCLFEGDHDGQHHLSSVHICSAMAVSSPMPASLAALVVTGGVLMLSVARVTTITLGVPVPPPKPTFSL